MAVDVNTGPAIGAMTLQVFKPGFRGGEAPFSERCQLFHEAVFEDVRASAVHQAISLQALEERMVVLGLPVPQSLAMWKLRCAYMKEVVRVLTSAAECPHECVETERYVGRCWECY